jgi:uncharacterized protein involved in response to NO
VRGLRLLALAALWLLGRVALACATLFPPAVVGAADLAFPAALLAAIARPLGRAEQRHNWGFLGVLVLFLAANAAFHGAAAGLLPAAGSWIAAVAVDVVLLLVVLVAGRIVPAFTRNALQRRGSTRQVRSSPVLDGLSVAATAGVLAADALSPLSGAAAAAKGVAAVSLGLRMLGWQGPSTRGDPLLWSLHASFACLPVGLALLCVGELAPPVPRAAGLHVVAIGGFAGMILSVMSRVALGHSGRPLQAPEPLAFAYLAVLASAALRAAGALAPGLATPLLWSSGALFSAAFLSYLGVYAPILARPRADGREG